MSKTAVEWLYYELAKNNTSTNSVTERINKLSSIWEQAKQMEKEQIMEAHNQGYADGYRDNGNSPIDYYNETYKSE